MKRKQNKSKITSFDGQHEDEKILFVFRRHIVVLRRPLIYLLLAVLVGTIPMNFWYSSNIVYILPFVGLLVGGLIFLYSWIGWYYSIFIISDSRFIQIKQKGLFERSVIDLGLDKIQNVNFSVDGIQETLLKFGTIVIQTFVGDLVLGNVGHPEDIHAKLLTIIKESSRDNNDSTSKIT